jgi:antitoxin VapB
MSLNIKNEETYRLVQELSKRTGESLTAAVTVAVKERLERLDSEAKKAGLAERLLAIGRDSASHLSEPWLSLDHGELLYGEDGLPK